MKLFKIKKNKNRVEYAFFDEKMNCKFNKTFLYAKPFFNGYAFVNDGSKIDFVDLYGNLFFENYCAEHNDTKYLDLQFIFSCQDDEDTSSSYEITNDENQTYSRHLPGGTIPFYRWIKFANGFSIQISLIKLINKLKSDFKDQAITVKNLTSWFLERNMCLVAPYSNENSTENLDYFIENKVIPLLENSYIYIRAFFFISIEKNRILFYGPYEDIKCSPNGSFIPIKEFGKKYGYIKNFESIARHNDIDKYIINASFDDAFPFSEGLAKIRLNNKYGYINVFGNFIIKPKYADARNFKNGLAVVAKFTRPATENTQDYDFLKGRFNDVKMYYPYTSEYSGFNYAIIDSRENVIQKSFFGHPIIFISNINNLLEFSLAISLVDKTGTLDIFSSVDFKSCKIKNRFYIFDMKINEDQEFHKFYSKYKENKYGSDF